MLWKQKFKTDQLQSLCLKTMVETIDIKFTEITDDAIIATMPVSAKTKQPMGLLHGGASAALAETLGSIASVMVLDDITKYQIVGTELNITHLKSCREGYVTGICKAIKTGRRVHVWEIKSYDEKDNLVSISRLSTMVIENKGM